MPFVSLWLAALVLPVTAGAAGETAPNDPDFGKQWGMTLIGAPAAWTKTTGAGVKIGIVDTGIDLAHEDLAGKVVASTRCIDTMGKAENCKDTAQDTHGHGSHVSGIAAATKGNGKGVAGVAPDAQLIVAKVTEDGGIAIADVNAALHWVVDQGAQVVNLSLGDPIAIRTSLLGTSLSEGLEYAWNHGTIPVLASGNSGLLGLGVGSSDYGDLDALVVGAVGPDKSVAEYSSATGTAKWALMAPGGSIFGGSEGIWSTYWSEGEENAYESLSGPSMAAPHVTGAVALLLAQGYQPADVVQRLLDTADSSVSCGSNSPTCRGLLNVAAATGAQ